MKNCQDIARVISGGLNRSSQFAHAEKEQYTEISETLKDAANGKWERIKRAISEDDLNTNKNKERIYLLIRACLATNETERADNIFCKFESEFTQEEIPNIKARICLHKGKLDDASAILGHHLESNQEDWEALAMQGATMKEGWQNSFKRSLALNRWQADTSRNLALVLYNSGNKDRAILMLKEILSWRPDYKPAIELIEKYLTETLEEESIIDIYDNIPDESIDAELLLKKARVLRRLKRPLEGWKILTMAEKIDSNNIEIQLAKAATAQELGRIKEAKRIYNECLVTRNKKVIALAYNNLAALAVQDGEIKYASELVEKATLLDINYDIRMQQAEIYIRSGERRAGKEIIENIYQNNSDLTGQQKRRVGLAKARLLLQEESYEEALVLCKGIINQYKNEEKAWNLIVDILEIQDREAEAEKVLIKGIDYCKDKFQLKEKLFRKYLDTGRIEDAIKNVQDWKPTKATKRALTLVKINLLGYMRRYKECEALIKEYCDEHPGAGAVELGSFYLSRDKPKDAIKACEKAINQEPERLRLYLLCSDAYQKLANWEGAEKVLEKALEIDPYRMDIKSSINALLIKQGKLNQAKSRLIEGFKKENSMSYIPMMAAISERTKDWTFTINSCKILKEQGNTDALITYANILTRNGDPKTALATLAEEGMKYPNNEKIQLAIEQQHILLEDYKTAKQHMLSRLSKGEQTLDKAKQEIQLLCKIDEINAAIVACEKYIDKWPNEISLKWLLVGLLIDAQKNDEAGCKLREYAKNLEKINSQSYKIIIELARNNHDIELAIAFCLEWINSNPKNVRPKWLMFDLLLKRNHKKAADILDNIKAYNPLDPQLEVAKASLCIEQRNYAEAISLLDSAINDFPANSDLKDLAIVAETSTGKFTNFDKYLDKVNKLRGELRYNNYRKYFFNINCHPHWSAQRVYEYHTQWYDSTTRGIDIDKKKFRSHNFDRRKKLKIGYISGDFKLHSVSYFSMPLLMHQRREEVELVAYANVNPNQITSETEVFKTYFDKWRDIYTRPDSSVMQQIKKDEIDILIDLSGHTTDNRLTLFSQRAAPIQVTAAFGSGQTTGIREIDYMLCDLISVPKDHEKYLAEKPLRTSFAGYPYQAGPNYTEPKPLPCEEENKSFVFGCITRPVRVNSEVCAAWGEILKHAPNSRLIFDHEGYKDTFVQEHLLDNLKKAGANENQITFRNTRPYWDVFTDIDLALDPWPAGSGTVGTDALWMQRVSLTLKARPIMGRWITSQLTAVGLENFCHDKIEEYINAAVHYATTREGRLELINTSSGLREKMKASVLGDYKSYADEVIRLYRKVWEEKCDIEQARINKESR